MARSRRGGGGFGASRRAPPARRPAPPQRRAASSVPAPKPAAQPPAMPQQQSSGGGMLAGIGSTIAQGMAFGTGSAIAHRAVGAAAGALSGGGGEQQAVEPQYADTMNPGAPTASPQLVGACANDKQMFFECLQVNKGDQQACSFLYEQLQTCQRNETSMSFN